jgi:hypothetical protein
MFRDLGGVKHNRILGRGVLVLRPAEERAQGLVNGGDGFHRPAVLSLVVAGMFAVALVPLFICNPLPLADYPNHLARAYILTTFRQSPVLQQYYQLHWQIIPNLALDLLVPQLARFMPVNWALLAFTVLTFGLLVAGCFALHHVLFGRLSYSPLAVFLLLYNRQFLWGMLNYLFSLGLALLTFALWIALRRKPLLLRCLIFGSLGFIVFISHLGGFALLGILIVGYELHGFLREKNYRALVCDVAASAMALGIPIALFLLFSPTRSRPTPPEAWNFKSRVIGLFEAFNNYSVALDAATFLLVVGAVLVGILLGKARLHRRMQLPLLTLAVLYWTISSQLLSTQGAARRLIPAIFLTLACSLEWKVRPKYLVAAIVLLFAVRTGVVVKNWSAAAPVYKANLDVMDRIPIGAKLAVAVGELNYPQLNNPPLLHLPALAVVKRPGLNNALFAVYGVQPLLPRPEYEDLFVPHYFDVDVLGNPHAKLLKTTVNPFEQIPIVRFDYLLAVNQRYFGYPVPHNLRPVYAAGDTILYRVTP